MKKINTFIFPFVFILMFISLNTNAQEIGVVDNKGTIVSVRNNNVTTANTAPANPVENDIWFDTSVTPTRIFIYDGAPVNDWVRLEPQGTPGTVFFAGADNFPTQNTSFTWDDTTSTLTTQNLSIPGTIQDSNGDVGTAGQLLSTTITGTEWIDNAALDNWLITGNIGTIGNTNFLGTIDDVKMQIRSFNIPILEFGRRQTLGLVDTQIDYTDPDQPLVFVNGDGNTSALQFAASGASFYKPILFSTPNGSFRMKGSTGRTDLFEIGSAGPNNDGRLEFIIGDDGAEPIIFKRFDFRNGGSDNELFRVQGSLNNANSKTRFGININPTPVPVDLGFDDGQGGFNIANSTFQVAGSISKSIFTSTGNLTLTEDHYTIIINGNHNINLPTANTCEGREYVLKNHTNGSVNIAENFNNAIGFIGLSNTNETILPANTAYTLQSDGTNWHLINDATAGGAASETLTSLDQELTTGTITYTDELNATSTVEVISADADNNIVAGTDGGAFFAGPLIYAAGRVSTTGTTITQYNSTINKTGTGTYTINFTDIGSSSYIVQLTPENCTNCTNDQPIVLYNTLTNTSFNITAGDGDNGNSNIFLSDNVGFMYTVIQLP